MYDVTLASLDFFFFLFFCLLDADSGSGSTTGFCNSLMRLLLVSFQEESTLGQGVTFLFANQVNDAVVPSSASPKSKQDGY